MPVIFVGHGNPMNAVGNNEFTREWERIGRQLAKPIAVLSISAHWLTPGTTKIHVEPNPRIIYDFYGFPDELYAQRYPAPGSAIWARKAIEAISSIPVREDSDWGLDHGTWTVMKRMFPDADVPIFQMSIDYEKPPLFHYELARELIALRREGILVLGSGNVTHNLRSAFGKERDADWATDFDLRVKTDLDDANDRDLVEFLDWGATSRMAHPTHDHFLPLISCIGLREKEDTVTWFAEGFDMGTLSMRSFVLG